MLMYLCAAAMQNRGGMRLGSAAARRPDVIYRERDQIRLFDRRDRRSPRRRSRSPVRRRSRSPRKSRSNSRSQSRSKSPRLSRYSRSVRYYVQIPKYSMDLWVCRWVSQVLYAGNKVDKVCNMDKTNLQKCTLLQVIDVSISVIVSFVMGVHSWRVEFLMLLLGHDSYSQLRSPSCILYLRS